MDEEINIPGIFDAFCKDIKSNKLEESISDAFYLLNGMKDNIYRIDDEHVII